MPVHPAERPLTPGEDPFHANARGLLLHAQGRLHDAADAFRSALAAYPDRAELRMNLATVLLELGRHADAQAELEAVLKREPDDVAAHLALYDLHQIAGRPQRALEHQARALARQTLFSVPAPREARSLLILLAPGDWQANVPVDFLIDRETTTLHKLYLVNERQARETPLPQADALMVGIAESDDARATLPLAQIVIDRLGRAPINPPSGILRSGREQAAQALQNVPRLHVPAVQRRTRADLESCTSDAFPLVVRPVGSHAGHGLERIEDAAALQEYVRNAAPDEFFTMPFVDYAMPDGYFRKYRIIIVDGVPYPYHLAISPRWMIHYYNAPMQEHAWMRAEEERFLTRFETVFDEGQRNALRVIAGRLDLDYVGVDCSLDRDGNVLLFEADPAMLVHAADDPTVFGYKIPAAQHVFRAFERLIERAGSR